MDDKILLLVLLDTGSMACTISEEAKQVLKNAGLALEPDNIQIDVVLLVCGGVQVRTKCICNLRMEVYECAFSVPVLLVPGQKDQLILGTNVINHLLKQFKQSPQLWNVMSKPESPKALKKMQVLNMLSGMNRRRGEIIMDVIGTAKLTQTMALSPRQEHLFRAKLPAASPLSEGSTILIEPSKAQTHVKNIIVCRCEKHHVCPMSGNKWVPVKILNTSDKHLTLNHVCSWLESGPPKMSVT